MYKVLPSSVIDRTLPSVTRALKPVIRAPVLELSRASPFWAALSTRAKFPATYTPRLVAMMARTVLFALPFQLPRRYRRA